MASIPTTLGSRTYKLMSDDAVLATFDIDITLDPTKEQHTRGSVTIAVDIDQHMRDLAKNLREAADEIETNHA